MCDCRNVEWRQDNLAAKISIAIYTERLIKRVHNIPTLILRRHLSLPVQLIDSIDDPVNIVLMGKELIVKLFEHIAGVIDHSIAGDSVEFHDGICQLRTTRYNPSPKDLETIAFSDQSKLGTVPGKTLDYLPLVRCCLHIGWGKLILDARIEFHGEIRQVPKNVM